MTDNRLREAVRGFKAKYGASYAYTARRCGVSREHISRWLHNEDYVISDELKQRLIQFTNG